MENEKLIKFIDSKKEEMIEKLSEFVRIESISDNKHKVAEALNYALSLGKTLGFETKSLLDGQVGVIEMGQGNETMGILSHVDVVGPGELSKWKTEPFEPEIIDEKIYGRGTLDDKGAIIASMYAMKAVLELKKPLDKKIQLILGTQEEVEWSDMREYVKNYKLPDYGFTPDGEFPICNIEKGCMDILIRFPLADKSFEESVLVKVEAGTAANMVPGKCLIEVTHKKEIEFDGKSVHSCNPEKGQNAINIMAKEVLKMNLGRNKLLELSEMIDLYFSDIYGDVLGLKSESEYYNDEFVHRNVFSPTIFKSYKNFAEININIRYAYGTDEQKIIERFRKLTEEYGGELLSISNLPAVYVSKESPFLKIFAKSYEKIRKEKNIFTLAYGGSYAKAMPKIVSWGPIFPGEEDTCHEENEYISIKSFIDNAKIFSLAIAEISLSEKSFR